MKIDVYTSALNGSKYLSVSKGTDINSLTLPSDIDADLLSLSPFRTRLEIEANKEHNALDQTDVLAQIERQGYAIHGAKQTLSLKAG